ncbi:LemA family protein [Geovibrio thiophilus]|uniref:LemA family protein n=1 Tax=Geovibrio thiophilus TaxID=139438 RepID=A0A3R5Y540_9BACT|nr:LemA family protein [Geovibrio thiophilus]QAR31928.1 LemA family protein [Geovibrio thiophilus]
MAGLVFVGVVALIIALFIYYYNKLVSLRNLSEASWSDIDVQLKKRWDLIPNLVETVKGYASHEKDTLENVTKARNMAMGAGSVEAHAKAENMLTGALKSLFALSESYPELKANVNFLELQNSINSIENDIQLARRYYNAVVRDLNTMCESFPSLIVAGMFRFTKKEYFEMDSAQRENVQVKF